MRWLLRKMISAKAMGTAASNQALLTRSTGVVPSSQIKTDGVDLTLATNIGILTKNGYTFAGWNTAPGGSGTAYATGAQYTDNAAVTRCPSRLK